MGWPWHRSPGTRVLEICSPLPPEVMGEQQPTSPADHRDRSTLTLVLEPGLPWDRTDTDCPKQKFMALTILLYHLDPEWCSPNCCGIPDLSLASLTHTTSPLASGWRLMWFFSLLPRNFFRFMSQFTFAFEGRVGTVLSQPEISAAVMAEATLFDCFVPIQGPTPTAPTEEPEKMKHKPVRDIQETFRKQVLDLSLLRTKCKCWLFWGL